MLYLDGGSLDLVAEANQGETTWTQSGSEPHLEIIRIVTCGDRGMVLTVTLTTVRSATLPSARTVVGHNNVPPVSE
jgi:hypothetical protein